MPLPRLSEIGDTFTGTVRALVLEGDEKQFARFYFEGYEDFDSLQFSRLNIDAKLMDMGFYEPPGRNAPASQVDGVVLYDQTHGERFTFSRVPPTRGKLPGWRIEKAAKPKPAPAPAEPPRAVSAPPTRSAAPFHKAMDAPGADFRRSPEKSPAQKRDEARARFDEEAARIVAVTVPALQKAARKAKVKLPPTVSWEAIFSAASGVVIALEKRGAA